MRIMFVKNVFITESRFDIIFPEMSFGHIYVYVLSALLVLSERSVALLTSVDTKALSHLIHDARTVYR